LSRRECFTTKNATYGEACKKGLGGGKKRKGVDTWGGLLSGGYREEMRGEEKKWMGDCEGTDERMK